MIHALNNVTMVYNGEMILSRGFEVLRSSSNEPLFSLAALKQGKDPESREETTGLSRL